MLTKRIIACLDVRDGRVVKGVQFVDIVDAGDPAELAHRHAAAGADEIVLLDITATHEGRGTLIDTVQRTAATLFVPFTVGGGIRSAEDAALVFDAGAAAGLRAFGTGFALRGRSVEAGGAFAAGRSPLLPSGVWMAPMRSSESCCRCPVFRRFRLRASNLNTMILSPDRCETTVASTAAPVTKGVPTIGPPSPPSSKTESRRTVSPTLADTRSTTIRSPSDTRNCFPLVATMANMDKAPPGATP